MRQVRMWLLPERKEDLSVMCGPERRFAESLQVEDSHGRYFVVCFGTPENRRLVYGVPCGSSGA